MSLERELQEAIAAARDAGAILRDDLLRPGGPRGRGDKADADREAERLIRARLGARFPSYGVRGEELPGEDRDGDPAWVVDPNDGTRDYLAGHRGSAVSIALVRRGVPVLGVVYAFAPPVGAEDLLTWAEGAPLARNGAPVSPRAPDALDPEHTVLVSTAATRAVAHNAAGAQPARFRPLPSIAYRLALVAAGEAEAAISLNGPGELDLAAGQALLRGASMALVDDGVRCFGGPEAICRELASRAAWRRRPAHDAPAREPYALAAPLRDRHVADPALLARAQGCLLGQIAGDSLGSLVEFSDARDILARHPGGVRSLEDGGYWNTLAGQPTDDSELALLLARALVARATMNEEEVARAYAFWMASRPFDAGGTTRRALEPAAQAQRAGAPVAPAARAAANPASQANGALMRVSPLGIFGWSAPLPEVARWARLDAALTHPHPLCQEASALYAATLAFAVGEGAPPAVVHARALAIAEELGLARVAPLVRAAAAAPPADYTTHIGWVAVALQNAFHQLLHASSLEAGVVDTVMRGGDTDTNAAIAGALLGAVHGVAAIPEKWRDRVLTCFAMEGLPGVRRPRPRCLWPVDALVLAERLLLAR